ncbi:MAG: accessory gene regulator B family protein [Anaerocolumna sp.]
MLLFLSKNIASFFVKYGVAKEEDEELYIYGLQTILSSIFSLSLILIIAYIKRNMIETGFYLVCLVLMRSYTGGYHAKQYWSCCFMTLSFYLLNMYIGRTAASYNLLFIYYLVSIFIILRFSPLENKNRPIREKDIPKFKIIIIGLCLVFSTAIAVLYLTGKNNYAVYIELAGITTAGSLVIGYLDKSCLQHLKYQ